MQLEFLGTGTSVGVPMIGCSCPVCLSDDPRNKRLRSSLLVRSAGTTLLVDSTPDLRQQALRSGFTALDGVLYTHVHLDHVSGFDDLRAFCWHREEKLPLYGSPQTLEGLKSMYPWAFAENQTYKGYVRPLPCPVTSPFTVGDIHITPVPVIHAQVETLGYVFEQGGHRVGYIADVKEVPTSSLSLLRDLDILIADALRFGPHPTHFSVSDTLALFEEVRPKRGYFTHISHDLDFTLVSAEIPDNVFLSYDGLVLSLPCSSSS